MLALHRLALLSMLLTVLLMPVDGIGILADLPLVKLTGLLTFGFVTVLIMSGAEIRGVFWFVALSLFYVCWTVLSFLWTLMPVDYQHAQAINSQQSIKAHLYLHGLVLLIFQVIRRESDLQWLLLAFLLGSFVLVGIFLSTYDPGATTVRHSLEELDANEMSVQLAMALPAAFYLLSMSQHWWIRVLAVVYLPLAVLSILATG